MIDSFSLKLTQFEKTRSINKTLFSPGNLIITFHFRNWKPITFYVAFTLLLIDRGVYLPFYKKITELKMKSKVKP